MSVLAPRTERDNRRRSGRDSDAEHLALLRSIDFEEARVCDLSGLEAINVLGERYRNAGKVLHVRHLSPDCRRMLEKAGSLVNIEVLPDDPHYSVAIIKSENSKIIGS